MVPRKGTWKGNFPPHSTWLETAGPVAREYADGRWSIFHGSLPFSEHRTSPTALHEMIQTHKQVAAAPLHFFIQNISWRSQPWVHVKWNIKVPDWEQLYLRLCDVIQVQRRPSPCLRGLKCWKICQSEKSKLDNTTRSNVINHFFHQHQKSPDFLCKLQY